MRIHTCMAGCGKAITWSFAICVECEMVYGNSALDWPEWLRFSWNDEQKRRRRMVKDLKNISTSYYYAEEVLDFVHDGKSFVFSNKRNDLIPTLIALSESLDSLSYMRRTALILHMRGYTHREVGSMLGVSKNKVKPLCTEAVSRMQSALSLKENVNDPYA